MCVVRLVGLFVSRSVGWLVGLGDVFVVGVGRIRRTLVSSIGGLLVG